MIEFKTGEDFYNKIYLHFNALIAITLIPFGILLLNIQKEVNLEPILQGQWPTGIVLALVSLFVVFLIYKGITNYQAGMRSFDKTCSLREKLAKYYSFSIQKYLWISGACAITVVGLFLTRSSVLIPGYVLCLVLLSIGRPTLQDMIAKMKMTPEEINILYKKENIA